MAQSALFFLSSDYDYLKAQSDTAQVRVCKAQHLSSTAKGHELEPPGLALEGLSEPQGSAGPQSLQGELQQPVPEQSRALGQEVELEHRHSITYRKRAQVVGVQRRFGSQMHRELQPWILLEHRHATVNATDQGTATK